jgi:cysteine-rich repeat protein
MRPARFALVLVLALGLAPGPAGAGDLFDADDHSVCYTIRDPVQLSGVADLTTPQFGLLEGCRLARTKLLCVPARKRLRSAVDRASKPPAPIEPLPVFGPPEPGDRICYRVKCRRPFPPDQEVTDQFGTRTLVRPRPFLLCTPAVKGAAFCGDGEVNRPEEDCDGFDFGSCRGGDCNPHTGVCADVACLPDCTCDQPRCGDGIIDPGEECDNGSFRGPPCSQTCRLLADLCGGFTGGTCPANGYCNFPLGNCGEGDLPGFCDIPPDPCTCPTDPDPVCGCDGATYTNACAARCARVSVAHPGACIE